MGILQDILDKITNIKSLRNRLSYRLTDMNIFDTYDARPLATCVEAVEAIVPHQYSVSEITNKDFDVALPPGYYHEGAVVGISQEDKNKLVSDNIRNGVSILGVVGSFRELPDPVMYNLAEPQHVLADFEYVDFDGNYQVGTMPSQGAKTITPSTSEQTAIPAKTYARGAVTVAAMPTATQATPSISIDKSTGVVTASATQSAGYVSAGTKSATMQLQTRGARVITPGKDSITILAGNYLTGNQTIIGSDALIPENIRAGITIFGVTGTYEPATGPYSILTSPTAFTQPNDWTIRLPLNSQGIADGKFKSGVKYQLVIDGVSQGTATGNGTTTISVGGAYNLYYYSSYVDIDLYEDISPTSVDLIANVS